MKVRGDPVLAVRPCSGDPVLGCLGTMALCVRWSPGCRETLGNQVNIDHLTQVVVPGRKRSRSPRAGPTDLL